MDELVLKKKLDELRSKAAWGFSLGLAGFSMAVGSTVSGFAMRGDVAELSARVEENTKLHTKQVELIGRNTDNMDKLIKITRTMQEIVINDRKAIISESRQ